jgi:DNA-binding transcriptional LysR family regulator
MAVELRELRAFVAVVEANSVSEAARRLQVSQPWLSQTIQALERDFGTNLLVRSSSGVTPTSSGTVLLGQARALIARHEQMMSAMAQYLSGQVNVLRVGIPLELPPEVVGDAIAAVSANHPGTDVQIRHMSTAGQIAALRSGDLECALIRELPNDAQFDVLLVAEEPLGVLLATEDLTALQQPEGVRLDALAALHWIGFPRQGSPAWYDELTAIMRSHGHDPGTPDQYDDNLIPDIKIAAIRGGGRFGFAPPSWSSRLPDSVHWVPLIGHPIRRRTWAAWPASSHRRDLAHLVASLRELHSDTG